MTYFSDFDFQPNYDDPMTRDRVLRDAEEEYLEETPESIPWDLLEDFQSILWGCQIPSKLV